MPIEPLLVVPASEVSSEATSCHWLVDSLWAREGVGVIGGAPKACKTWLALELALSVASGSPCLGRFAVPDPGPVLFYGAEDPPAQLAHRMRSLASARGLDLDPLDLGFILESTLRLDCPRDRDRLALTLEKHRPRLLVLDPLVRLHRSDENSAADISALLGELRALQRQFALAIVLVHHLRKNGSLDGQALRGSGDLFAWGDSYLFVRRRESRIQLVIEHRAAPTPPSLSLEFLSEPSPHLRVVDPDKPSTGGDASSTATETPTLDQRLLDTLRLATRPMPREVLRQTLHARNADLGDALVRLRSQGLVLRAHGGFLCSPPA